MNRNLSKSNLIICMAGLLIGFLWSPLLGLGLIALGIIRHAKEGQKAKS